MVSSRVTKVPFNRGALAKASPAFKKPLSTPLKPRLKADLFDELAKPGRRNVGSPSGNGKQKSSSRQSEAKNQTAEVRRKAVSNFVYSTSSSRVSSDVKHNLKRNLRIAPKHQPKQHQYMMEEPISAPSIQFETAARHLVKALSQSTSNNPLVAMRKPVREDGREADEPPSTLSAVSVSSFKSEMKEFLGKLLEAPIWHNLRQKLSTSALLRAGDDKPCSDNKATGNQRVSSQSTIEKVFNQLTESVKIEGNRQDASSSSSGTPRISDRSSALVPIDNKHQKTVINKVAPTFKHHLSKYLPESLRWQRQETKHSPALTMQQRITATATDETLANYKFWLSGSARYKLPPEPSVLSAVMKGHADGATMTPLGRAEARSKLQAMARLRDSNVTYPESLQLCEYAIGSDTHLSAATRQGIVPHTLFLCIDINTIVFNIATHTHILSLHILIVYSPCCCAVWSVGGCGRDWHKTFLALCEPRVSAFKSPIHKQQAVCTVRGLITDRLLVRFGIFKQMECRVLRSKEFRVCGEYTDAVLVCIYCCS